MAEFLFDINGMLRKMQEVGTGVELVAMRVKRKVLGQKVKGKVDAFNGKQAIDWLVTKSDEPSLHDRPSARRLMVHWLKTGEIEPAMDDANGSLSRSEFVDSADVFYIFTTTHLPQAIHDVLSGSKYSTVQHVISDMMSAQHGLEVKDRKWHFKKYRDAFIAQEAVAWLMDRLETRNRDEAIVFGNFLVSAGWIRCAVKPQAFRDKVLPFQFIRSVDGSMLATDASPVPASSSSAAAAAAPDSMPLSHSGNLDGVSISSSSNLAQTNSAPLSARAAISSSPAVAASLASDDSVGDSGAVTGRGARVYSFSTDEQLVVPVTGENELSTSSSAGSVGVGGVGAFTVEHQPAAATSSENASDSDATDSSLRDVVVVSEPTTPKALASTVSAALDGAGSPSRSPAAQLAEQSQSANAASLAMQKSPRRMPTPPGILKAAAAAVVDDKGDASDTSSSSGVVTSTSSGDASAASSSKGSSLSSRVTSYAVPPFDPASVPKGNPLSALLDKQRDFVARFKSRIEALQMLQRDPKVPVALAASIVGNLPALAKRHEALLDELASLEWSSALDDESLTVAQQIANGMNSLGLDQLHKAEQPESVPEEVDRQRRSTAVEHHSPLHLAASSGDMSALLSVLEIAGVANIEQTDTRLWTPLHLAAHRGHVGSVETLLAAGAKPTATTNDKTLPLHLFVRHSHRPTREWRAVMARLCANVSLNHQTLTGETPLHFAGLGVRTADNIRFLVARGADINVPNARGNTPLHNAIVQGRSMMVRELLLNGADASAAGAGNQTCKELAKRRMGLLALLGAWKNVYAWWTRAGIAVLRAATAFKALYRLYLSHCAAASAAHGTLVRLMPGTLPDDAAGVLTAARSRLGELVDELRAVLANPSCNEHVVGHARHAIAKLGGLLGAARTRDELGARAKAVWDAFYSFPPKSLDRLGHFAGTSCARMCARRLVASDHFSFRWTKNNLAPRGDVDADLARCRLLLFHDVLLVCTALSTFENVPLFATPVDTLVAESQSKRKTPEGQHAIAVHILNASSRRSSAFVLQTDSSALKKQWLALFPSVIDKQPLQIDFTI
jgi:ankyrin repeat protein